MHAQRDQLPSSDARIAGIARRQYGVVTHAQLVALGLGRGAIAHRIKTGRLHRLHVGVYAVGHAAPRPEMRWLAAVLACGDGAVLSRRSASVLWAARTGEGRLPDVTVATRSGRSRVGVAVHREALEPQDRCVHRGIPVTSPARTLVDLAAELDRDALLRLVRELQFVRRFELAAVQEVLARRPRRELARIVDDLVLAESGLEDRLLDICDAHGLPRPLTQKPIGGKRIDFVWPAQHVAVETDGWEGHGTRTAFQTDRTVSNRLQLAGYAILRFTDADLKRRPKEVASQIEQALRRGAVPPGSRRA